MAGPQQTPGRRNKACSLSFCCVTERGTRSRPNSAQTGNIHACPASRGPEEPPAQRARRSRRAYHPRSEKRRADRPDGEQRTSDTTYDRSPAATRDKEKYGAQEGEPPPLPLSHLCCRCPQGSFVGQRARPCEPPFGRSPGAANPGCRVEAASQRRKRKTLRWERFVGDISLWGAC